MNFRQNETKSPHKRHLTNTSQTSPAAPKHPAHYARGPKKTPLAALAGPPSRHHNAYLVRTHRRRPGPYALAGEGQGSQRGGMTPRRTRRTRRAQTPYAHGTSPDALAVNIASLASQSHFQQLNAKSEHARARQYKLQNKQNMCAAVLCTPSINENLLRYVVMALCPPPSTVALWHYGVMGLLAPLRYSVMASDR
eukprot:3774172-Prymnesium_polylepis.1